MDPNTCDTGLATPSLQHGCSTQVTKGKWIKVTRKSGDGKNIKDDKARSTYAEALMKADRKKEEVKDGSSKMGFPPAAEVKTSENPFNLLDQQDEEALEDTEAADNQSKRQYEDQSAKSSNKRTKKDKNIDINDDFYDVCDEYAKLPAPEYAYSVRNTQDDKEVELLRCDESMNSDSYDSESSEEGEEHPDDYHKMDEKVMHTIRCADDIYKFHHATQNDGSFLHDDRIQYGIDLNKRKIRRAFESIYNDGRTYKLQQLTNKARSLPKIYDMVYPAMLNK